MVLVDANGIIRAANSVVTALSGYRADLLIGAQCTAVLAMRHTGGQPAAAEIFSDEEGLGNCDVINCQKVVIRCADGADLGVEVAARRLGTRDGSPGGWLMSLRSVDHGSVDHGSVDHGSVEPASEATGFEVITMVSHELRSPLTSIKGYSDLMLNRWERLEDGHRRQMLEQMNRDADRLRRLVTELLDVSRIQMGRLMLRPRTTDLAMLAGRVIGDLRLEYPDLDATVDFPVGFPAVLVDPDKIEQVMTNLIENACKYASPRGIVVQGALTGTSLRVTVSDQGPGIDAVDLANVFDKFFRRPDARPSGLGLGLWISRGLVEAHGGVLVVESVEGVGSSFSFTLPLLTNDLASEPDGLSSAPTGERVG